MKQFSLILFSLLVCSSSVRGGDAMPGDLLRTLNAAIDSSEVYTGYKKARIEELRLRKTGARSTEEIYRISELDLSHLGHVSDSSTRLGYYITVKELS